MQQWYKDLKAKPSSRVKGTLTVDRIRTKGGWPKLAAKAAATRHLAAVALNLAQDFGLPEKEERQILGLRQLLVRFYEIIDSEFQFLSASARLEMPELGQRFVGLYTALATSAKEQGLNMWKLQPKLHLFIHLCEWQCIDHGNPRYYWTYADEDLAGSMAEVAASCHPRTMASSCLFKWLHLFFDS